MTWTGSCCVSESQTYFIRTIQLVFYFYLLIINTLMVWPLPPHFQCQEFGRDTMWGGQRLIERKTKLRLQQRCRKRESSRWRAEVCCALYVYGDYQQSLLFFFFGEQWLYIFVKLNYWHEAWFSSHWKWCKRRPVKLK